jgi:hypothetical protein
MRKVIFLPSELVESLHLIAVHDGFPKIAALLRGEPDGSISLDLNQAKLLARFAQYLQMRARRRSAGDDSKVDPVAYERITLGLPDKLLSYLLGDFPECV